MTDEKKEREVRSPSKHELAETPFGGYSGELASPDSVGDEERKEEQSVPTEEPETFGEELETVAEGLGAEEAVAPPGEEETSEPLGTAADFAEETAAVAAPVEAKKQGDTAPVDYSRTFRQLTAGDVVEGTVVHIDKEGVLVDVGTKSEGVIRLPELAREAFQNPEDVVQVGQQISVYVMNTESEDGNLLLSKKRADFELAWSRVEDAYRDGKVLNAMVSDRVKGGLVVDLGIRGFVPGSHVGSGKVKNLERYVGQSIPLRVIEVDRERRKVVLSHRLAIEDEREQRRKVTLTSLAEGQVRQGIVRRLTDYGAFIDLGGIDGLLHISEMSWTRINHPSDVLRVGQRLQVIVLKLNLDQGKVSLGLRQILPDPWREVERRYSEGDVIKGKVTRLVPFGAFVQVDGGVEGIIPVAELAPRRVSKPEDVVSIGQEVEAKVIDLRPDERRMTLSLRQLQQERERRDYPGYAQQPVPRTTVADLVGEAVTRAAKRRKEETEEEEPVEAAPTKPPRPRGKAGAHKRVREEEITEEDLAGLEAEEILEEEAPAEPEPEEEVPGPVADEPKVTLGDLLGDKISVVEEVVGGPEQAETVVEAKPAKKKDKKAAQPPAAKKKPKAEPKPKRTRKKAQPADEK